MHVHRETLNQGLADELEFDREVASESVQVGFNPRVDGEVGAGKVPSEVGDVYDECGLGFDQGGEEGAREVGGNRTWRLMTMSISCGPCEAKAGYVEVYPTLLIRTVSRLSTRSGRMASERSVPRGEGVCCVPYEDGYGTLGVASEQLGTDSL